MRTLIIMFLMLPFWCMAQKDSGWIVNWDDSNENISLVYSNGWDNEIEMIDGKVSISGDTVSLIKSLLVELKTANDKLKADEFIIEALLNETKDCKLYKKIYETIRDTERLKEYKRKDRKNLKF